MGNPTRAPRIVRFPARPATSPELSFRSLVLNCRPVLNGQHMEIVMNGIVYLVGLVVIVLAILSFLGLR